MSVYLDMIVKLIHDFKSLELACQKRIANINISISFINKQYWIRKNISKLKLLKIERKYFESILSKCKISITNLEILKNYIEVNKIKDYKDLYNTLRDSYINPDTAFVKLNQNQNYE